MFTDEVWYNYHNLINSKRPTALFICLKTMSDKAIITLLVIVGLLGGLFLSRTSVPVLGSAGTGYEFNSTTTSAAGFAGLQVKLLSNVPGVLGSVVISSTTPATPSTGTCVIRDATSTTDTASTTLASFPIQPTQGTYAYNTFALRGIIVECGVGFSGSYTITTSQR